MERNPVGSVFKSVCYNLIYIIPLGVPFTAILLFLSFYPQIAKGNILEYTSFPLLGGFEIHFLVDGLSLGCGVLISSVYLLAMIYSMDYIKAHRLRYYSLLTLNLVGMLGLILSQDLLGFYIFFEIISLSGYFLIIHSHAKESLDAGYKYIVMMLVGGLFILTAMLLLFIAPVDKGYLGRLTVISFSLGCLLKAGAFPLHTWLPDAHPAAPTPVSALLSGTMIKVGAYGLVRAFFYPVFLGGTAKEVQVFSFESLRSLSQSISDTGQWLGSPAPIVIFLGVLSMVIGVSFALLQHDLKRLLAYHSVSQIGYILLGIGVGGSGLAGGIMHIFSHAIFKGLLFLAVGAVIFRTKIRNIHLLGGLWRKMPVTTCTCVIAALSISGVPLTSGYASKGIIFGGLHGNHGLEIIFVLTSAGTCASFLKLVRHTFFGKPHSPLSDVQEVSGFMYIPMLGLALGSLMLGIFPAFILNVLLGPFAPELHLWTLSHIFEAILSLGIGVALYTFLLRMGVFDRHQHQATKSKVGSPKFLGQSHILKHLSIDRFYNYIARGIFAFCVKLEEIHHRSLSIYLQIAISFLVIIIFISLILLA